MTTLAPRVSTRTCLGLTATFLAITGAVASEAEELGHHQYHDSDYRHWKQPGTNISCCSDLDCAPVRAELRHGRWFALRRSEWSDPIDELGQGRVAGPSAERMDRCAGRKNHSGPQSHGRKWTSMLLEGHGYLLCSARYGRLAPFQRDRLSGAKSSSAKV